jgi:hypothetical protein
MDWNIEVAQKINLELQKKIELNSPEGFEDLQQMKNLTKDSIRQSIENFLNSDEFDKWFDNQIAQNNERLTKDGSLLNRIVSAIKKNR